jgi:predicted enzyme related to lactoylglutathione lyase
VYLANYLVETGKNRMNEKIEFLSAILIVSKDPERLANFYKDIIGMPLEVEQHGKIDKHYGCELGDLHFAIHPTSNFEGTGHGTGSVKLAFTVFDMKAFVDKVKSKGYALAYEPKDTGFAMMTALTDPDGNYVEFTQLSDRWFKHLENRRSKGFDVLTRWQSTKR